MFIIYGVMAFVTILGCIAMYGDSDPAGTENQLQEIFFTAAMVFYVLGVFALFVVSYVYMCVHFYKTMYSDQGYLTHTLPVGQMSIFNVKLLVSLCWLMLSLIIMFVSIFALGCAANRGFSFDADFDMLMVDFQNLFGMSLHTFSIYMIFAMILSCLQYLLMVFASGSIGQLFTKHKVGASIGAGIVFYMSGQIVSSIILVLTGYFGVMNNVNVSAQLFPLCCFPDRSFRSSNVLFSILCAWLSSKNTLIWNNCNISFSQKLIAKQPLCFKNGAAVFLSGFYPYRIPVLFHAVA